MNIKHPCTSGGHFEYNTFVHICWMQYPLPSFHKLAICQSRRQSQENSKEMFTSLKKGNMNSKVRIMSTRYLGYEPKNSIDIFGVS